MRKKKIINERLYMEIQFVGVMGESTKKTNGESTKKDIKWGELRDSVLRVLFAASE